MLISKKWGLGRILITTFIAFASSRVAGQIPTLFSHPRSTNVATGLTANFSVSASGASKYQWFFNDNPLTAQTNSSFIISNVIASDAGNYQIVATNNFGSTTSQVARLVVGNIAVWGATRQGQANVPLDLSFASSINAGPNSCAATRPDGTVRTWSSPTINTNLPANLTNIVQVSAGSSGWLGLRTDGSVTQWWGGDSVTAGLSNVVAVAGGWGGANATLQSDGTVITWPGYYTPASKLNDISDAVAISIKNKSWGKGYLLALRANGRVVVSGGAPLAVSSFVAGLSRIVAIAAGAEHCVALTEEGKVLAGGNNGWGQTNVPPGLSNIVGVAAGATCSLALKADGTAMGWGDAQAASVPAALTNIICLDAGDGHGMALLGNGQPVITVHPATRTVFEGNAIQLVSLAAGSSPLAYQWQFEGEDIPGATNASLRLTQLRSNDSGAYRLVVSNALGSVTSRLAQLTVLPQRSVAAWGFNGLGETEVPLALRNVVRISAGAEHAVALLDDGAVVAWGDNSDGQCNVPLSATNVVEVAAGGHYTMARRGDGTLVTWGFSPNGPSMTGPSVGIAAGNYMFASIQAGGLVTVSGNPSGGGFVYPPATATNVTALAVGNEHLVALRSDGIVVSWGSPFNKALPGLTNVPPSLSNVTAIAAGDYHTVALRSDGSVVTWGLTSLGLPDPPVELTNVVAIAAAGTRTLALDTSNQLWIWGTDPQGQQTKGLYSVPAGLSNLVSIAAGYSFNLALISSTPPCITQQPRSRSVPPRWPVTFTTTAAGEPPMTFQWQFNGANLSGSTNSSLTVSNVTAANIGEYRVVVSNRLGSAVSAAAPLRLGSLIAFGRNNSEQNWIPADVTNAVSMAIGWYQALAIRSDGTVETWGSRPLGEDAAIGSLSDARTVVNGGTWNSLVIRSNGEVVHWGSSPLPATPASCSNVVSAAVGPRYVVACREDGATIAFGDALFVTNMPAGLTNIVSVSGNHDHVVALRSDGTVAAWGYPSSPFTNVPPSLQGVKAIASGFFEAFALKGDGTVVAWGTETSKNPIPDLKDAVAVASGAGHTWALRNDGSVYAWGSNPFVPKTIASSLSNVVAITAGFNAVLVKFGDGSPEITVHPFSQKVRVGQAFTLTTLAAGQPTLHYQWQRDGADLPGATNNSLSIPAATIADAGAYRCIITNALGAVTCAVANVTIVSTPPPRFDLQNSLTSFGSNGFAVLMKDLSGLGPLVFYASSNLVDWVPIFTNPASTDGLLFVDPTATNLPQRFYRASEER